MHYCQPIVPCPTVAPRALAPRRTTARPSANPSQLPHLGLRRGGKLAARCRVLVIDTGFGPLKKKLPPGPYRQCVGAVKGQKAGSRCEQPDGNGDDFLDPVAGHGTFISGLFGRLAPGAEVTVVKRMGTFGDIDDADAARAIVRAKGGTSKRDQLIVTMSFRGYTEDDGPPLALSAAILARTGPHVAFVASAGNDASCRPTWPACLGDVIGVGALGVDGPAPFTNYGPHVEACAPGVDIVSTFLYGLDPGRAKQTANPASDLADFGGWVAWSGTSFSAPIVATELAWEVLRTGAPLRRIVDRTIRAEGLTRIAGLGTIVNVC
jgi:subtilisin family serine protease